MKAIVQDRYGPPDLLELREVGKPAVEDGEVLVRVHAASVHPDVWHVVTGRPYVLRLMGSGLRRPKQPIPGTDMAGRVESVGKDVTRFRPGDAVFGETTVVSQWKNGGAFAEYVSVPQDALALKPERVTFEQAAAVPTSGGIILQNLPDGQWLQPGRRVLVNGAGGGVGAVAVQIFKARGVHVTGVDHTKKLDLMRSLGADRVIDYTKEDFTEGGERYDVIFDVPGNHPFTRCRRALAPEGVYILIGHHLFDTASRRWLGTLPHFFKLVVQSMFVRQLPKPRFSGPSKQDMMSTLQELLETGKLTPVIDRTYPLAEVPEAIRYLAEGNPRGRIIITV
jgi:NADPH:quinone reductase-like Zn-dependent oxidoreductase